MSRAALFLIVEGRDLDPVFYDRLISARPELASVGHVVRNVDTIDMPAGQPQSGKAAVLALFLQTRRQRHLTQVTSTGKHSIVFVVDRDLDSISGKVYKSAHLIYTVARDVEAELHLNGDHEKALATALSTTAAEAADLVKQLGNYVSRLGALWRDWIELGAVAAGLSAKCSVQPGRASQVNVPRYGPVDTALLSSRTAEVLGSAARGIDALAIEAQCRTRVAARYARGEAALLVKGKWLGEYLVDEVRRVAGSAGLNYGSFAVKYTHSLLDNLDFRAHWAASYQDRLLAVI